MLTIPLGQFFRGLYSSEKFLHELWDPEWNQIKENAIPSLIPSSEMIPLPDLIRQAGSAYLKNIYCSADILVHNFEKKGDEKEITIFPDSTSATRTRMDWQFNDDFFPHTQTWISKVGTMPL